MRVTQNKGVTNGRELKGVHMELVKTFSGYKIKKGKLYYAGIKAGHPQWVTDYTYGKAYQKKTADKIINRISKGI